LPTISPSFYTFPAAPYTYTTGNIYLSQSIKGVTNIKYTTMDLSRKKCPISGFVSGKMVTLGILGTDVECAYAGKKLIFSPGSIRSDGQSERITVSVEYDDAICHYNIGIDSGAIKYLSSSPTKLMVSLVSTIKKKRIRKKRGAK
jgi:hypothetical protein